jgi:YegS/Rv2252/BmrU family lipid kinase
LIVNPGAGKPSEMAKNLKLVIRFLQNNGLIADVAYAKPKEEATSIARRAVRKGYKIIIAMGGDGTIEAVIRGMGRSKARLGIIPAGTNNNLAMSLGIPKDLQDACDLIASNAMVKLDLGQIKINNSKKFLFFELATLGLSADIYPAANKVASGKLSKVKEAALTFLHHEVSPKIFLTLEGESKVAVETMLVVVSNTPVFGKNFLVAPQASLQDGLLDISVYPDFSKVELLGYYAAVMDGGYSGNKKVQQYQARKIKIKTSPELKVMADGVVLGSGSVSIKVHPKALRVITTQEGLGLKNLREASPETKAAEPASPTAENNPASENASSQG